MRRLALALLFAGCATDPVRFADRAVLWQVAERPTPLPVRAEHTVEWAGARDALVLPADHFFGLGYGREAEDTNSLDEAPDSGWFQDPRRVPGQARPRALAPGEIAEGASTPDDEPALPLTIEHGKQGGSAPGFVVKDARGRRYVLKLDPECRVGLVSSTEVVATRLGWAFGYRVPSERVIDLRDGDLRRAPGAWTPSRYGHRMELGDAAVAEILRHAGRLPDGRIRAVASRWIEGRIIGPFAYVGRERADLNDTVRHEDRRTLRGLGVFASWIGDVDTMENNTLDSWVDGRVLHYQQDLGGSFGTFAGKSGAAFLGDETYFSPARIAGSTVALGFWRHDWETRAPHRGWPEWGDYFGADDFDPRSWRPILDNPAFVRQTARDRYWGAKRIAAFSAGEVRAAIAAGRYRPEAAERLFQILWERRTRILRAFLGGEVAPLDYFRFEAGRLCFDDLWIDSGLGDPAGARYSAREENGDALAMDGRCVALAPRAGYRVVELQVERADEKPRKRTPVVSVHFIEAGGARRILGVDR